MKTIEPISIWNNGTNEIATILNITCIYDNMFNSAIFSYQLYSVQILYEQIVSVTNGELTLIQPDYTTDWTTNDAAYNWAAIQLGLTITGEYTPPVPPIEEITPITE